MKDFLIETLKFIGLVTASFVITLGLMAIFFMVFPPAVGPGVAVAAAA